MECASSDTPSLLTAPELTRLRANHPCVVFAGIIKSGDVVLVQDSGGRELALKPGLNIIGGVQPRGLSVPIAPTPDIEAMLDEGIVLDMAIESILLDDILAINIDIDVDVAVPDTEPMLDVATILEVDAILDISCIATETDVLEALMSILFLIPDILEEETGPGIVEDPLPCTDEAFDPKAVPAWRIYSGRHSTRPNPLARRLSTQNG